MLYLCTMQSEFITKWQSQMKKGLLSFVVLQVLKNKELYGYELIESVKRHTSITIAEGTLYPLMNRLKKTGLVSSKWVEQESGIPRKYYQLTALGIEELNEMQDYWEGLARSLKTISK